MTLCGAFNIRYLVWFIITGLFVLVFFTVPVFKTHAQCSGIEGVYHLGVGMERGHSIVKMEGGGYLLSGTTESFGAGMEDWLVIKTDENFTPIWSRAIGYPSTDESGMNVLIKELATGELILAGYQWIGGRRGRVMLLSPDGVPQWALAIDGSFTTPRDIMETPDGGVLISGTARVPEGNSDDAFVTKVDFAGNVEWSKRFDGGPGINDHFQSTSIGANGNYFAVGGSMAYNGTHAGYLVEMSPDGTIINHRFFNINSYFLFLSIVTNPDGSFLITGHENVGSITSGIVMKINSDFSVEWARKIRQNARTYISFAEVWNPNEVLVGLSNRAEVSTDNIGLARLDYMTGEILELVNPDQEFAHIPEFTSKNFVFSPENGVISIGTHDGLLSLIAFNNCLEFECMTAYDFITSEVVVEVATFSVPSANLGYEIINIPSSVNVPISEIQVSTTCDFSPCSSNPTVSNQDGCVNESISYSILFDGIILEDVEAVDWDFGSGITSVSLNPDITYSESGVFPFVLTIITSDGCEYVIEGETQIYDFPGVPVLPEDIALCEGEVSFIDFDQFPFWDSIVGPSGLQTGVYEFDATGSFSFDFYNVCGNYNFIVNVEVNINENILSQNQNVLCVNENLEVTLNLSESSISESDLLLSFGDGFEIDVIESPVFHSYSLPGNYSLNLLGTVNGCPVNESLNIEIEEPILFALPPSLKFCENESGLLDFSNYDFEVQNSAGQIVTNFESTNSGVHTFIAQNVCGMVSQSIEFVQIDFDPVPFGFDQTICPGQDTAHFGFQNTELSYSWNNGSSNAALHVTSGDEFISEVSNLDGSCLTTYVFEIFEVNKIIKKPFQSQTIKLCEEGSLLISPVFIGFPYTFPDGSTGYSYHVNESGILTVTYNDGCYDYEASSYVLVEPCLCPLYVPNAFTPNEDGLNDIFRPALDCPVESYHMTIFNRWGQEIFTSDDVSRGWNGRSPNKDYYASTGVYFYVIRYTQMLGNLEYPQVISGHCTLLR